MAKNIHDLTNAARKIQENLDRRAQEQGEQFAQRLINSRGSRIFFTIALAIIFSGVAFSFTEPFLYAIAAIIASLTGGFVSFGTSQVVVGMVFLYLCYALAVRIVGK